MKTRSLLWLLALGGAVVVLLTGITSCAKIAGLLAGTQKEEDEEAKKKEKTAFDTQVKAFTDPASDAAARNTALAALRDLRKEEGIPYLIKALEDPDKTVVLTAVRGLGTYSYLPPLDEDEREIDPEAREKAEKLKAATDEQALQPLLKAIARFQSSDPKDVDLRWWALWGLQNMAASEQVEDTVRQARRIAMLPVLRKALRDENRDVRVLALDTLVVFKDPGAVPDLRRALADPDPHVRRRAAMGLGELQAQAGVPNLVRALQKDPDMGVRVRAAQALSILKDPTTVVPLLAVLEASSAQIQRLQQELEAGGLASTPAQSAGRQATTGPSTRAVEELKKELDNQTALQESAILALSRIDDERARAKIEELDRQEFATAEKAIEEMKAERKKRL